MTTAHEANASLNHATTYDQTDEHLNVQMPNGVHLQFRLDGARLCGLSAASIHHTALMAPTSLRLPHLETRDGWLVHSYRYPRVHQRTAGIQIETEVWATRPVVGRRLDMFQMPYLSNPVQEPHRIGTFRWHLQPETRAIGHSSVRQTQYQGFSYSYEWELDHPFHWMLDAGTWELEGNPEGVNLLSQHKSPVGGPMEFQVSRGGEPYISGETFPKGENDVNFSDVFNDTANDPSERYIIPIQAQLRGAGGALLDTQWKSDMVLLGFFDSPDYYRTLIDWRPAGPAIAHLDQHYFPLTNHYKTPRKTVVAAQVASLTRLGAINLWTDALEQVGKGWRDEVGLKAVRPQPMFGLDSCGGAGVHLGYGPADLLDKWESYFSWFQENGFKGFYLGGIGNHRGHELPGEANLCQPYDYRVHARYGGEERFRHFCDKAHQHGLWVALWIGVPSNHAPILKEHPDWIIHYDSGAPWDGNYITLNSASLQRGYGDWLMEEAKYLKDLGVDRLYIDSYHNLWAMPVDYSRPDLNPQFKDVMDLQGKFEAIGLQTHIESIGPLGLSSIGLWPQYVEHPEMCYGMQLGFNISAQVEGRPNQFRNGTVPQQLYWRMLANGATMGLGVMDLDNQPFEGALDIPHSVGAMHRVLNALAPVMQMRTLHEDGAIAWHDPESNEHVIFVAREGNLTGEVEGNFARLEELRAAGVFAQVVQALRIEMSSGAGEAHFNVT